MFDERRDDFALDAFVQGGLNPRTMALVSTCVPRFFTSDSILATVSLHLACVILAKFVRLFGVIGDVDIATFNRLGDHG